MSPNQAAAQYPSPDDPIHDENVIFMSDLKNDPNAQKWMAQWRHAAIELPKIRAKELRELTDDQATQIAIGLTPPLPYRLRNNSGLQKWQEWMARLAVMHAQPHE